MVKVPVKVFNEIMQLLKSGFLSPDELNHTVLVASFLRNVKSTYASDWVDENPHLYKLGLLEGFEVDQTWKDF